MDGANKGNVSLIAGAAALVLAGVSAFDELGGLCRREPSALIGKLLQSMSERIGLQLIISSTSVELAEHLLGFLVAASEVILLQEILHGEEDALVLREARHEV